MLNSTNALLYAHVLRVLGRFEKASRAISRQIDVPLPPICTNVSTKAVETTRLSAKTDIFAELVSMPFITLPPCMPNVQSADSTSTTSKPPMYDVPTDWKGIASNLFSRSLKLLAMGLMSMATATRETRQIQVTPGKIARMPRSNEETDSAWLPLYSLYKNINSMVMPHATIIAWKMLALSV